jgi:hypothetical protein
MSTDDFKNCEDFTYSYTPESFKEVIQEGFLTPFEEFLEQCKEGIGEVEYDTIELVEGTIGMSIIEELIQKVLSMDGSIESLSRTLHLQQPVASGCALMSA